MHKKKTKKKKKKKKKKTLTLNPERSSRPSTNSATRAPRVKRTTDGLVVRKYFKCEKINLRQIQFSFQIFNATRQLSHIDRGSTSEADIFQTSFYYPMQLTCQSMSEYGSLL